MQQTQQEEEQQGQLPIAGVLEPELSPSVQQEPVVHGSGVAAGIGSEAVEAASDVEAPAAIMSSTTSLPAVSRSNPFAVAFDAAAACDPSVAAGVGGDEAAVACSGSSNPFDDGFAMGGLQLKTTGAAASMDDAWPQQQQQPLQPVVQLPAIRLLQAQRCDVSYDDELHAFTPLSGQVEQQHDSDVFTYMPTAEVLEQQDRQLWPQRTHSWQWHQEELQQQQQQLEGVTGQLHDHQQQQQQLDADQCRQPPYQQLGQVQQGQQQQEQQVCAAADDVVEASPAQCTTSAPATGANADSGVDGHTATPSSADSCSSEEDAAETAALAAAAPLDDIELKHRGSPRCCQAQTQPQQQQHRQQHLRQLVAVRRAHSCEAEVTAAAFGSPTIRQATSSGNGSRSQLPLRRVCSSDAEGVAAPGSGSSSSKPCQGSSPKSRRQAAAVAAAVAEFTSPVQSAPPPHSDHLLYERACVDTSKPSSPLHGGSPRKAAACAVSSAAAAKLSRRVSGSAGSVKLVPLIDFDEDSSSEPPSSRSSSSSSSRGSSASDAGETQQLGGSNKKASRQDSSLQQGRVRQRLPTPKASLTGDEGEEQPAPAAAAASVPDELADGEAAQAAAAAAANSLVAGLWQQQQPGAAAGSSRASSPAKSVRFCEWVEQLEFGGRGCGSDDDDSSSVESFTEEQLLEAQVRRLYCNSHC
jgi:hypothetical protein